MKHVRISACVISIAFFAGSFLYAGNHFFPFLAMGSAKIACDEPVQNLGNVSDAEAVVCKFMIANAGKRPLIVQKVSVGCGACVEVVGFPKEPILPGKDGAVAVRLLTDRLRGEISRDGVVTKSIAVMSNDPERPALVLTLRAQVQRSKAPDEIPAGSVVVETLREGSDVIGSEK